MVYDIHPSFKKMIVEDLEYEDENIAASKNKHHLNELPVGISVIVKKLIKICTNEVFRKESVFCGTELQYEVIG